MTLNKYQAQRERVTPPYVALRAVREVSGKRLEDVAREMNALDPGRGRPWTTGAISAVELGHRGASPEMLVLLARVYGFDPDLIDTAYVPRARTVA